MVTYDDLILEGVDKFRYIDMCGWPCQIFENNFIINIWTR
jgi:hypothetical protein